MNNSYPGYDIFGGIFCSYGGSNLSTDSMLGSNIGNAAVAASVFTDVVGLIVSIVVPLVVWIVLCVLCYIAFMSKKADKSKPLSKFFDFQRFYAGKIFRIFYMVFTIGIPAFALSLILLGIFSGYNDLLSLIVTSLLIVFFGEIFLRVSYELVILFVRGAEDLHAIRWDRLGDVSSPADSAGSFDDFKGANGDTIGQGRDVFPGMHQSAGGPDWAHAQGAPIAGAPMNGLPMQGAPGQASPMQGAPVQGMTMQGAPMPGEPMQNAHMQGSPMQPQPFGDQHGDFQDATFAAAEGASAFQATYQGAPNPVQHQGYQPPQDPFAQRAQHDEAMPAPGHDEHFDAMPAPGPDTRFGAYNPQQQGFAAQPMQQAPQSRPTFGSNPQGQNAQGNPFGQNNIWA